MLYNSLLILSILLISSHAHSSNKTSMNLYYGYATSDNLARNKIDKIKGNYSNLEANITGKSLLHMNHNLLYRGGFKTKRHINDLHADNFDENLGTAELGNQIRVGKTQILGLQTHYLNYSGRTIDFQTNSTEGRDSRFSEIGAGLGWQNLFKPFSRNLDFTL